MARIDQIVSTARYLRERVVTNAELTARFTALGKPTVIDRLAASTEITKRFYVRDDGVTLDLALPAAKEALKRAGRKPQDIDLIILGATSPHYITPRHRGGSIIQAWSEKCRRVRRGLRLRVVSTTVPVSQAVARRSGRPRDRDGPHRSRRPRNCNGPRPFGPQSFRKASLGRGLHAYSAECGLGFGLDLFQLLPTELLRAWLLRLLVGDTRRLATIAACLRHPSSG
jgi:hypothetical protein